MPEEYPAAPAASSPWRRIPPFRSAFQLADHLYTSGRRLRLDADGNIVNEPGAKKLKSKHWKLIRAVENVLKAYLVEGRTIRPTVLCVRYEEAHAKWVAAGRPGGDFRFRPFVLAYAASLPPPSNAPGTRARRVQEAVEYAMSVLRRPVVERRPPPVASFTTSAKKQSDALPANVFFRVRGRS